MRKADVVVVGLGAMGGAVAAHAALNGLTVVGFDRWTPPHDNGSSAGWTRVQRCAYFEGPEYVPLAQRALELWRQLEEDSGRKLWFNTGVLGVGRPPSPIVERTLEAAALHGVECEEWDAEEVQRRVPALAASGLIGAWEPGAGVLRADACIEAHLAAARHHGAQIVTGVPVSGWNPPARGRSGSVFAGGERVEADWIVLAAGAWLSDFAGGLPGAEITVERQVQLYFDGWDGPAPPVVLIEYEPDKLVYLVPNVSGHGTKVALHHEGDLTAPDAVDRYVSEADVDRVRSLLATYFPSLDRAPTTTKVCLYENTADENFLFGSLPGSERTLVVGGGSGHGFKFASALGEAAADLMMGRELLCDVALFDPGRFG